MNSSSTNLGSESIPKLMFKLATPAIIAQLVNVFYNIIDRIFIGRMQGGDLAMAGVGVAFPIIILITAFSLLVGMGGAPLVAMKMGEEDNDGAEKILSNSFTMLILLSIVLTIVFSIFKEPILWAFGASDATIEYAKDYIGIYLLGTVFVQIALGMNPYINTQGFAKIGMMTVTIGAVINIILDPILIFGFGLGVKGAALATVTSQAISAIWALSFLLSDKSILKIKKQYLMLDMKIVSKILVLGSASFIIYATESLVLISLNSQLSRYGGDLAISAMTIISSIMQLVSLPTIGLSQGAQPIISYNFGAKQMDRVRKAFKLNLILSFSYTVMMWAAIMLVPQVFVSIFNNDPALMGLTVWSMRIYFAGILMVGVQFSCQQTFLALGQAKVSFFLALLRKVILLVPLVYIIPMFMQDKLFGVLLAEPIADIVSALTTAVFFAIFYKKNLAGVDTENMQIGENPVSSL